MRMAFRIIVFAFISGLFCIGCAELKIGQPINVNGVQRIRPGYTTKEEVTSIFGQPLHNVPGPEGDIWVYRYLDGKSSAQELVVSFNGRYVSTFKLY